MSIASEVNKYIYKTDLRRLVYDKDVHFQWLSDHLVAMTNEVIQAVEVKAKTMYAEYTTNGENEAEIPDWTAFLYTAMRELQKVNRTE